LITIREFVVDLDDPTLDRFVESWDGLGRYAKTAPMSFVLTSIMRENDIFYSKTPVNTEPV
jgi:hypothetical protein